MLIQPTGSWASHVNGAKVSRTTVQDASPADRWTSKQGEVVVQGGTLNVIEVSDKLVKVDFICKEGFRNETPGWLSTSATATR